MRETAGDIRRRYEGFCRENLSISMERGWPCREQLELSMPMLDLVGSDTDLEREVDYRGYAGTAGIEPLKKLFAEVLDAEPEEVYIGGTMSTTIMYDLVNKGVLSGFGGCRPWKDLERVRFLCPVPGYEKHFKICETFGIEMVPVEMDENGPDMDTVEKLVREDESVKGIWCVPLYSNPTGAVYSDETVIRLASMKTAAEDFRIFWDNAYCVHHLTDRKCAVMNIRRKCEESGYPDRVFEFASTSKITFPGGGVGVCVSSRENIRWLTKASLLQLKSGDKINQLRHYLFLKDAQGVEAHMKKHRDIIGPKFELTDRVLHEELDGWDLAEWKLPLGGYFFNVKLKENMAHEVWKACKKAGVSITPAGSTFPYGKDPEDAYLRLAPTYPSMEELEKAMHVLGVCIKLAGTEKRSAEGAEDSEN